MTKSELKSKLIAAGLNRYIVRDEEWQIFDDAECFHVSDYDLDQMDRRRVKDLVGECKTDVTDKGVLFIVG